jgi:co-chaperonin GroES (HSP10)
MTQGQILPTKLLVKEIKKEDTTTKAGLVILADSRKDPNIVGDVVLTGIGTEKVPMLVHEGDRVFFNTHSFQTVRFEDVDYKLLDVRDVLFWISSESKA